MAIITVQVRQGQACSTVQAAAWYGADMESCSLHASAICDGSTPATTCPSGREATPILPSNSNLLQPTAADAPQTTQTPGTSTQSPPQHHGLSAGAIIGICVPIISLLCFLVWLWAWHANNGCLRDRDVGVSRRNRDSDASSGGKQRGNHPAPTPGDPTNHVTGPDDGGPPNGGIPLGQVAAGTRRSSGRDIRRHANGPSLQQRPDSGSSTSSDYPPVPPPDLMDRRGQRYSAGHNPQRDSGQSTGSEPNPLSNALRRNHSQAPIERPVTRRGFGHQPVEMLGDIPKTPSYERLRPEPRPGVPGAFPQSSTDSLLSTAADTSWHSGDEVDLEIGRPGNPILMNAPFIEPSQSRRPRPQTEPRTPPWTRPADQIHNIPRSKIHIRDSTTKRVRIINGRGTSAATKHRLSVQDTRQVQEVRSPRTSPRRQTHRR